MGTSPDHARTRRAAPEGSVCCADDGGVLISLEPKPRYRRRCRVRHAAPWGWCGDLPLLGTARPTSYGSKGSRRDHRVVWAMASKWSAGVPRPVVRSRGRRPLGLRSDREETPGDSEPDDIEPDRPSADTASTWRTCGLVTPLGPSWWTRAWRSWSWRWRSRRRVLGGQLDVSLAWSAAVCIRTTSRRRPPALVNRRSQGLGPGTCPCRRRPEARRRTDRGGRRSARPRRGARRSGCQRPAGSSGSGAHRSWWRRC